MMTKWNDMLRRHGCNIPKASEGLSKARFEVLVAKHGRVTAKQIKAEEFAAKLAETKTQDSIAIAGPATNIVYGRNSPEYALAFPEDCVAIGYCNKTTELLHTVSSKKCQDFSTYNLPSEKRARLKRRMVKEHLKQLKARGK